jgi:5-methylcytosine-specific restriction protein B
LGPGFQIGHSYFCPVDQITSDSEWYLNVINTEIKPLIEEYWFDSPEKVDTLLAQLVE